MPQHTIMHTAQLLDAVRFRSKTHDSYIVEAALTNGFINSTHWLHYWDGRYYDEGCDGHCHRTSRRAMLADYPTATWHVAEES
jgi:hypothetical protein